MKSLATILSAALCAGIVFSTPAARADGIAIKSSALAPDAASLLESQIQAERAANPGAFDAVKNVRGHRPEVYRNFRNPYPTTSRELRGLGPAALLPMLEALAVKAPARGALTDSEWDALAIGMLEAVGMLRDARSRPVLAAVFEAKHLRSEVRAAAARALGRLGGDPELALLVGHAKQGDSLELHAIQGLGELRRLESAKHLAGVLATTKHDAVAEVAATALGTVGSSWAWRALGPKHAAAGLEVRKVCSKALAARYARTRGSMRGVLADAIMMAEHPDTVAFLQTARAGAGADVNAVDALIARVEKQQRRKRR